VTPSPTVRSFGALLRRVVRLDGDATDNAAAAVAHDDNARRERQAAQPAEGEWTSDVSPRPE
jgi:hypothetical protein